MWNKIQNILSFLYTSINTLFSGISMLYKNDGFLLKIIMFFIGILGISYYFNNTETHKYILGDYYFENIDFVINTLYLILCVSLFMAIIYGIQMRLPYWMNNQDYNINPQQKEEFYKNVMGRMKYFMVFMGIATIIMLYLAGQSTYPEIYDIVNYSLLALSIIGIVALVFYLFRDKFNYEKEEGTILNIIKNIIFYLPCIFLDVTQWLYNEFKLTPNYFWAILLVNIVIILLYIFLPYIASFITLLFIHDSKQLLNDPVYLDERTELGNFQNLSDNIDPNEDVDDSIKYSYSISAWFYISPDQGNNKYYPILDYGEKPLIEYNTNNNNLRVVVKKNKSDSNTDYEYKTIYSNNDLPLQRWNNIIINNSGGTIDVFLNNEIVASEKGVIMNETRDSIYTGHIEGLQGGICNVMYFNRTLSLKTINYLYYLFKDKNIPIV